MKFQKKNVRLNYCLICKYEYCGKQMNKFFYAHICVFPKNHVLLRRNFTLNI